MLLVHHQVVRGQVVERGDGRAPLEQRPPQSPSLGPEDLLLAEHDQAERGDLESGRALAHHHPEPLRAPEGGLGPWLEVVLGQHLAQAIALPLVVHHQADREALAAPVANLGRERLELAAEAAHRARAHRDAGHRTVAALEQRQLEPLEAREQGRERRRRRRVVGRRLQQRGILQDDQGLGGQVVEQGDRRRVRRAERQHGQFLERPDRALRRGIEEAQRLHLVAEELGARRLGVRGGEDVDDAAPQAPLPDLEHRLHPLVAGRLEEREQDLPVAALADGQGERATLERLGRRHRDREPGRRRHDGHRVAVQQPAAAERALGVRLAVAATAPGGARARRELEDAPLPDRPVDRAAGERGHEERGVLGGLVALDRSRGEEQDRPPGSLEQPGGRQGAGRAPEAVRAQAGDSLGEGRQDLVEGGPAGQDGLGGHAHHTQRLIRGTTGGARRQRRGALSASLEQGRRTGSRARWPGPRSSGGHPGPP